MIPWRSRYLPDEDKGVPKIAAPHEQARIHRKPLLSCSVPGVLPAVRLLFTVVSVFTVSSCNTPSTPSTQLDRHATVIKAVFDLDRAAGERFKTDVKADRVAAARAYTQTLRGIDLRSCPADFQEAFLKHRYAWGELVPYLEKYSGFTGDLIVLFELGSAIVTRTSLTTEGDREFDRIRRGITQTYYEVEKVALRYGVQADH
jgi:hypothetical protein